MKLCHSSQASALGFSIKGNGKKKGYLPAKQAEAIPLNFQQQVTGQPGSITQLWARHEPLP